MVVDETMQTFVEFISCGCDTKGAFTKSFFVGKSDRTKSKHRLGLMFETLLMWGFFKESGLLLDGERAFFLNDKIMRLVAFLDNPEEIVSVE